MLTALIRAMLACDTSGTSPLALIDLLHTHYATPSPRSSR